MLSLGADENFNNDIDRGLLRRAPNLNIVRIQDAGRTAPTIPLFGMDCSVRHLHSDIFLNRKQSKRAASMVLIKTVIHLWF
jgi:hypothetical protein